MNPCWPTLLLAALCHALPAAEARKPPAAPSEIVAATTPSGGIEFAYCIPGALRAQRDVPLVISYHGAGGDAMGEIKAWVGLAESGGFAIACPTSLLAGHGIRAGGHPLASGEADFQKESDAAVSIVEMLSGMVAIDRRRVMITGYSGGGNPSYWSGLFRPDVFHFVCTRSGNWPALIAQQLAAAGPRREAAGSAAAQSRFYVFWGERDHPLILGTIQEPLAALKALAPAHLQSEMIPGMGHEHSAPRAAAWFATAMREAEPGWAAQAPALRTAALDAARAAQADGDLAMAVAQAQGAALQEARYPKLGQDGRKLLAELVKRGREALSAAKTLASRRDPGAEAALADVARIWAGTEPGGKAGQALDELRRRAAKKP